jgi:crotonobetainyl-CoA:carnitine CoA-transferase CaiB-like acyl-CoA transferase
MYAVSDINDLLDDPQMAARKFWVEVEHPELGTTINYPGPFARSSETSCQISRRAPLIGEHNLEVYEEELGISREELVILKQAGVI